MLNFTFGDDHARANAMVHFPCGSTHAEAETAAQRVSPGDEGMLGPASKSSLSKYPSWRSTINISDYIGIYADDSVNTNETYNRGELL